MKVDILVVCVFTLLFLSNGCQKKDSQDEEVPNNPSPLTVIEEVDFGQINVGQIRVQPLIVNNTSILAEKNHTSQKSIYKNP